MKIIGIPKWKNMADDAYELYTFCNKQLREDLIVVFCAHSEEYKSSDSMTGEECIKIRTMFPGQAAAKQELAKFLNYNLYTMIDSEVSQSDIEKGECRYKFRTQSNGKDEARSVLGVLPYMMNNDLGQVISLIREKDLCIA